VDLKKGGFEMELWRIIVVCICGSITIFSITMLIRNQLVFKFRMKLLEEEDKFIRQRILNGKDSGELKRHRSLPSYNTMLWSFFTPLKKYHKPLSDFYKD
jgi:hypothetical protein